MEVLHMSRATTCGLVLAVAATATACATTSFQSTWKAPGAQPLNARGKKVAALIVSKDEGVRYGAEDALAREISARGAVGIPAYSLIPRELVQDKEKAKAFLEKAGVAGVVAMRVVGKDQQVPRARAATGARPTTRPSGAPGTTAGAGAASTSPGTCERTRS
jgi:hypothetical protein